MRRRRIPCLALLFLVAASASIHAAFVAAVQGDDGKASIEDLAWLAGAWEGGAGRSTWETCYTTPAGGEVLSASKEIANGRVVTYDFERFHVEKGVLTLTPFPHGRASVSFPVLECDPKARKAVFENPSHDFPRRFTYEAPAADRLKIELTGEERGKPLTIVLELRRRK